MEKHKTKSSMFSLQMGPMTADRRRKMWSHRSVRITAIMKQWPDWASLLCWQVTQNRENEIRERRAIWHRTDVKLPCTHADTWCLGTLGGVIRASVEVRGYCTGMSLTLTLLCTQNRQQEAFLSNSGLWAGFHSIRVQRHREHWLSNKGCLG